LNYSINHTTTYTYQEPVSLCHNVLRLVPRNTGTQLCKAVKVNISPEPDSLREYEDFFGNKVIYFSIEKEHAQLKVNVHSEIAKRSGRPEEAASADDISQYIFATPMTTGNEEMEAYARVSFLPGRPLLEAARDLMHRIYTDFSFTPGFTTISTPLSVVMRERKGVCQDFAHLAIACVRSVGLPARYVSGYIETISPSGVEKLVGVDASHAWFSIYVPEMGWVDFDPTNDVLPGDQHITIGWGRDYADIAPMKGIILSSGSHELAVSVDVRRSGMV
jgi:transglutaminase-like putative cysteine protease